MGTGALFSDGEVLDKATGLGNGREDIKAGQFVLRLSAQPFHISES